MAFGLGIAVSASLLIATVACQAGPKAWAQLHTPPLSMGTTGWLLIVGCVLQAGVTCLMLRLVLEDRLWERHGSVMEAVMPKFEPKRNLAAGTEGAAAEAANENEPTDDQSSQTAFSSDR